jgi:tetratricopeptide (TPR) repeat protein/NAD-dependent dihydropyrimidine dehydrogenase PreA subunit
VYRLYIGDSLAVREVQWTREGFWDTFPGLFTSLVTFAVCGFASVWFLGSKGYCTYACPYGAIFGVADRFALGRIRVTDACKGCGHCTASCTSNVAVGREVHEYGMVVDPGCMKCMDCVSVCPENALHFGFGKPSLGAKPRAERKPRKPRFGWHEEAVLLLGFALGYAGFRGLHQERGLLLALGLAGLQAWFGLQLLFMVTGKPVAFPGLKLSDGKSVRPLGWALGAVFVTISLLWIPRGIRVEVARHRATTGFIALHEVRDRWFAESRGQLSPEERGKVEAFIVSARRVEDRALIDTPESALHSTWAALFEGDEAEFEARLAGLVAGLPDSGDVALLAGHAARSRGDFDRALQHFERALRINPDLVPVYRQVAALHSEVGRPTEALATLDLGISAVPTAGILDHDRGVLLAAMQRLPEAMTAFESAFGKTRELFDARSKLATLAMATQEPERALAALRGGIEAQPGRVEPRLHFAQLLLALGRVEEAAPHAEVAYRVAPQDPSVLNLMGLLAQARGEMEGAQLWFERARAATSEQ